MIIKNSICVLLSALVMLLFPWCAVTFIKGDGGMAGCFLLFFAINPIVSVAVGIFSGRNIRVAWFQPMLLAILFLFGTWIFFDMGEPAFILYAAVYLLLGYAAMLICGQRSLRAIIMECSRYLSNRAKRNTPPVNVEDGNNQSDRDHGNQ